MLLLLPEDAVVLTGEPVVAVEKATVLNLVDWICRLLDGTNAAEKLGIETAENRQQYVIERLQ